MGYNYPVRNESTDMKSSEDMIRYRDCWPLYCRISISAIVALVAITLIKVKS